MSDSTKFLIKAFARKALTWFSGILVTYGVLTSDEGEGFVGQYLEEIVGATILAISVGWSWFYQKYVKAKIITAKELPADASAEELEAATQIKLKAGV